jgi:hypothetical protein
MVYLYDACDKISDFCHQQLLRKMRRKICWTDRGKTVYPRWQKSDIWSQASYRYPISWEAFLNPSDSYFLFADFVDFYTHLTYICICTFFVAFFSATIDDRNLIFGHKLHIGMGYLYEACDQISDLCHQ